MVVSVVGVAASLFIAATTDRMVRLWPQDPVYVKILYEPPLALLLRRQKPGVDVAPDDGFPL